MFGFYNRMITIDLTDQTFAIEDEVLQKYLGGKGLATHLLLEKNPAGKHLKLCKLI